MKPANYDHFYTRPPMRMLYMSTMGAFDVTGVVPELASDSDPEFIEWKTKADEIIASGHSREWIEDRLSSLTY